MAELGISEESSIEQKVVLEADEAFELLRKGVSAWNAWVEQNPVADVFIHITAYFDDDDDDYDYDYYYGYISKDIIQGRNLNFSQLKLPKGKLTISTSRSEVGLNFTGADLSQTNLDLSNFKTRRSVVLTDCQLADGGQQFENMSVDGQFNCRNTHFGKGNVSFDRATFGNGASFENALFSQGDKSFAHCIVAGGDFNLVGTHFSDGNVSFANVAFKSACLDLHQSEIGDANFNFNEAQLHHGLCLEKLSILGDVSFVGLQLLGGKFNAVETTFSDGDISFAGAQFNHEFADFSKANFGKGNVCFDRVTFEQGVSFEGAAFGEGDKSFVGLKVGGGEFNAVNVLFADGDITFKDVVFDEGVNFTKATFKKGERIFSDIKVIKGTFNADEVTLGKGDVKIQQSDLGGGISFNKASFSEGFFRIEACSMNGAIFIATNFSHCQIIIEQCQFTGNDVVFRNAKIMYIAFMGCNFDVDTLDFSIASIDGCFIDLDKEQTQIKTIKFKEAELKGAKINAAGLIARSLSLLFRSTYLINCHLCFDDTEFKGKTIDFECSIWQESEMTFNGAILTFQRINFDDASFTDSDINFDQSRIADTSQSNSNLLGFYKAQFDNSQARFNDVVVSGDVNFEMSKVCNKSSVYFSNAIFEKEASFGKAQIDNSEMNFYKTRFEKAYVDFGEIKAPNAYLVFEYTHFGSNVSFAGAKHTNTMRELTFKFASFEGSFDLTNLQFGCVVDLTHTKFTNQVALDGVRCKLPRKKDGRKLVAVDEQDTGRLRRLKEIAENNKDHQQALHFHADEMRAKRWNEHNTWQSVLDVLFDVASDYGQSIIRPFVCLAVMFVFLVSLFSAGAPVINVDDGRSAFVKAPIGHAANLVLSNSVPFLTTSKSSKEQSMLVLFGYKPAGWVYVLLTIHTGLSLVFLFLMGLGFRNRFRI